MSVIFPHRFLNIADDTSVQVSNAATVFHALIINKPANTAGVITIYDSLDASGTIVASITIGTTAERQRPTELKFDVKCSTGLFIVFDGVLASADVTVIYE